MHEDVIGIPISVKMGLDPDGIISQKNLGHFSAFGMSYPMIFPWAGKYLMVRYLLISHDIPMDLFISIEFYSLIVLAPNEW